MMSHAMYICISCLEGLLEHIGGELVVGLEPQRLVVTRNGIVVPALFIHCSRGLEWMIRMDNDNGL